jgi:signal transduction histidine kinase
MASAQAYEQERKRAEALAEIDRAKTAFFSNVSHEFRTPLSLILGPLTDALVSGKGLDLPAIDLAHRNSVRLLKLVNSLLDFSRIEAGRSRHLRFRRPFPTHFRAGQQLSIGVRARRPEASRPLRSAFLSRLRRSRHVGENRSQFVVQCVQIHF